MTVTPPVAPWTAFPSAERAVGDLLASLARTGNRTPADPDGTGAWMPFIRVMRVGGADDRITDRARLTVDCFAATGSAADTLAEQARQMLLASPGSSTDHGTVDYVTTESGPHLVPSTLEGSAAMSSAIYRVSFRR